MNNTTFDTYYAPMQEQEIQYEDSGDILFGAPRKPTVKPAAKPHMIAFGISKHDAPFQVVTKEAPEGELEFMERTLMELRATYPAPIEPSLTLEQAAKIILAMMV